MCTVFFDIIKSKFFTKMGMKSTFFLLNMLTEKGVNLWLRKASYNLSNIYFVVAYFVVLLISHSNKTLTELKSRYVF